MRFEENDYIDLTNIPKVFIYFLLQGDEVVYVGQTTNGLARVYTHKHNKQFNKICVIECDQDELNYLENFYILKYRPFYNKTPNAVCSYSLKKLCNKLNQRYCTSKFTKRKVKKMLDVLSIKPILYNGILYTTVEDYYMLIDCIDDYTKGVVHNEVFNIRV